MLIDDALLPAAAHLTGAHAVDVLAPAVVAAGGELLSCRPSQVQYRPQADLVVRYRCDIRTDGVTSTDTLLAATTVRGPFAGTLPIEAATDDGDVLSVGVWRWPFDPILTDLTTMVTPRLAAPHLTALVGGELTIKVVAYRPTERAVIRVQGRDREIYVKVVSPATTASLVERHDALSAAGLPVPRVLDAGDGWVAMEALHGTTLRDRLKRGIGSLPSPGRYRELLASLATVELSNVPPVRSRVDDAPHHARMLATVLPDAARRIDGIVAALAALAEAPVERRVTGIVHGDLHEAQLVVDDHSVIGLLDIDDVGPGDPLDDLGTLIGHLRFRSAFADRPLHRVDEYADAVRAAVAEPHHPSDVDRHIAAVLVGLATGPFRIQHPDWVATTSRVLDLVEHHLEAAEAGRPQRANERNLSNSSSSSHVQVSS